MANEGYMGKFELKGERAATDDHPVIMNALPLAEGVSGVLAPGTLMKAEKVTVSEQEQYVYSPWAASDTEDPLAVVDVPCETQHEKSVKCVVHGCVKTHMLKVGSAPADAVAIHKLRLSGIFAA